MPKYSKDHPDYRAYVERSSQLVDKKTRRMHQTTSLTNPACRSNLIYGYEGCQPGKNDG